MIFERGQRVPIRIWARSIAPDTIRQLQRLASQPYVVDFVAAMADAHVSEGVAVGTVFATLETVVPEALGGDLGCGMSASRLDIDAASLSRTILENLLGALRRSIPAGSATHRRRGVLVPDALLASRLSTRALEHTRDALLPRHLATLGGGNHFVELDRDANGHVWLLVHSGSRGLGAAVAAHHQKAARAPEDSSLRGLDATTEAGEAYLNDLAWTLDVARANRAALANEALRTLADVLGRSVARLDHVDVHHNFVARETWQGRSLLIHRKGAIAVSDGTRALVPGSMGSASYVVRGLGNPDAFGSCSHGAGRVLTRKAARAAVSPKALAQVMRRVVFPDDLARQLVEEAPAAYRDLREVLDDQEDLIMRETRLEPLAVLKG